MLMLLWRGAPAAAASTLGQLAGECNNDNAHYIIYCVARISISNIGQEGACTSVQGETGGERPLQAEAKLHAETERTPSLSSQESSLTGRYGTKCFHLNTALLPYSLHQI